MRTTWNLRLLYKSPTDPNIERDITATEKAQAVFEKKYRNRTDYLFNERKLLQALQDYEALAEKLSHLRPLRYLHLLHDIETGNKEVEAKINVITERLTKSANKLIFFGLNISTMDKKRQKRFLKSSALKKYRYYLKVLFDRGSHRLTEPEERILNLKSIPSYELWVRANEKLVTKQVIEWQGKHIPISEAQNILSTLETHDRRKLQARISDVLYSISDLAEAELNAVVISKKISDELKDYRKPYSATVLNYENDEKSVEQLVATVTKHFPVSHRFYNLKKKILKLPHLEYEDRAAKIGAIGGEMPYQKAYEIVKEAINKIDPKYPEMLERFSRNGHIDVFPKKGKRGGAYCSGTENSPTYVLLNHVPNLNATMTLAHEMGHAFHTELSKSQPILYQDYSISVAEVASTFFEAVVFDHLFGMLSDDEKKIALHDKIQEDIQTIFRQIACFNFEHELHVRIRERGSLSKEEIAALMNRHMKAYLGPAFKMKERDGYAFVSWPHLRYFFYVYAYAYGQIISKALYDKYKRDPTYLEKIERFLSAGSSMSPEQIFQSIGINTADPAFFADGLKSIEKDVKTLEKLMNS